MYRHYQTQKDDPYATWRVCLDFLCGTIIHIALSQHQFFLATFFFFFFQNFLLLFDLIV